MKNSIIGKLNQNESKLWPIHLFESKYNFELRKKFENKQLIKTYKCTRLINTVVNGNDLN